MGTGTGFISTTIIGRSDAKVLPLSTRNSNSTPIPPTFQFQLPGVLVHETPYRVGNAVETDEGVWATQWGAGRACRFRRRNTWNASPDDGSVAAAKFWGVHSGGWGWGAVMFDYDNGELQSYK